MEKELEHNEIIKEYLKLIKNKEVKKYIDLINSINNLENTIKEDRKELEEMKKILSPHHNLLFISDETTTYDKTKDREYYRCMCLDCELIARFLFANGKRENTYLITTKNIQEYVDYGMKTRKRVINHKSLL